MRVAKRSGVREVLPGVHHWTALHPGIGVEVSSYYLGPERVLIDPLLPPEGLEWLRAHGPPEHVLMTNRHHYRDADRLVDAFGVSVRCNRAGLHEFSGARLRRITPYDPGDTLPGGLVAAEVGVICPDETALHLSRDGGALALADGVTRDGDGPLAFVPDELLGDDPAAIKAGLRRTLLRLVEALPFDHLLLAHGHPWIGGGKEALRRFAAAG